ncbi:MAG: winged helix-turn-helix domain-containing protein [Candidatus Nanoarchaeia archaeon]|nr:winged helix-turn-helix domain-containing protein [Candidatus Nanoarchaeia archaeon]
MLNPDNFSEIEFKILKILFSGMRFMSTKEISVKTGYAWETCLSYLKELYEGGYVLVKKTTKQQNTSLLWKFNYERYRDLKKQS